jgi:hypothetical protein
LGLKIYHLATLSQISGNGNRDTADQLMQSVFTELTKEVLQAAPLTIGGSTVKNALQNIAK